jgi:hypothetical protein
MQIPGVRGIIALRQPMPGGERCFPTTDALLRALSGLPVKLVGRVTIE